MDFYSNSIAGQDKMQRMINNYITYHQIAEGKLSIAKSSYFYWQWKIVNSNKKITNMLIKLNIKNKKLIQNEIQDSIGTLGVFITLSLS